ncbi:uncharacterized protein LOC142505954 [Primulina tabacum]|uniref:uncharacterized protein LOC142505954 n=1 Tax=Primulina tabacum TaxID=48773 RepID=UPI003F5A1948
MKICSWNIREGGSARRKELVRTVIRKENPDIVVVLETKNIAVDRRFVASLWKSRFVDWVAEVRSGGILVMWDPRVVLVSVNLIGNFSVCIEIRWKDETNWWFTSVYGPCNPRDRDLFWDELAGLCSICGDKWCVGGEFNVIRNLSEKMNSTSYTTSMYCFDNLIEEMGLHDPPLLNAKFTWSNFRANPICCRLDRFLISGGWKDIFPSFRQTVLPRITSNHYPIVLDTTNLKWGPTPFIFENVRLMHNKFKQSVAAWWNTGNTQG